MKNKFQNIDGSFNYLTQKHKKILIEIIIGLLFISIGVTIYLVFSLLNFRNNKNEVVDLVESNCKKIESIPITIMSPGSYCLTKNFVTNETAIDIQANDVVIDMDGHKIQGPGTTDSYAIGVTWDSKHNIAIKNGIIEGFFYGIYGRAPNDKLSIGINCAASNISIENMVLLDNSFRGIRVDAAQVTIKNNLIQSTGGTTVYDDAYSMGIEVMGPDCLVQGNRILETYPVGIGEGVGISLSHNIDGCQVINNFLSNKNIPFPGRSFTFWVTSKAKNIKILNNYAQGFVYPFQYFSTYDSVIIARNIFSHMECSIDDYPDYYKDYPYTYLNHFIFEVAGCNSDDPTIFLPMAEKGDPLAMYRLGIISKDLCESKSWYEKAAALGHKESAQILKKSNELFIQAGCD